MSCNPGPFVIGSDGSTPIFSEGWQIVLLSEYTCWILSGHCVQIRYCNVTKRSLICNNKYTRHITHEHTVVG